MNALKLKVADPSKESREKVENENVIYLDDRSQKTEQVRPSLKLKKASQEQSHHRKYKKTNKYFYKVSNHHELFKIGQNFYQDYQSGVKSFAITSTGYQTSQQKTILGLASFFDHKEDLKIGIISDNLFLGVFKDIIKMSKTFHDDYFGEVFKFSTYSFYDHFEFINLEEIVELVNMMDSYEEGGLIDYLMERYDVLFWDVPELHKIQQNSENYFPVIMKYESISIIAAKSLSKKADIDDIQSFFMGYGLNLKGLILEDISSTKSEGASKKKAWWRIFS